MKKINPLLTIPYYLWIGLFVIAPVLLIVYYSFIDIHGNFTLSNYGNYFGSGKYLMMTFNSFLYAFIITFFTVLVSYPMAYFLTKLKHKELWLLLVILPTWVNLLLKAYAFIGIFGSDGSVNHFLSFFGIGPKQILFTDFSFIVVATYIQIPFMIMPIFNALEEINPSVLRASRDLGANEWQTFFKVVMPLSMNGVKSGIQAVFIPSLSLFMLTRLIGGNRVITLGTAIEEHFLVTQNWGMGSTIGVVLIVIMFIVMVITGEKRGHK
ncbi:ABC transporter permease [Ligilactobacillus salivarius]|jgi:spermidine/putrescine transport system permease protein|uniref:Spermidine/putrescine ABC transporter permease n=1 Tax=Ligilactobacillus salivarius TaxID=1624 RepID=A0A1V9TZS8_9LACO|nr:ABC transporter permease [Ligilactobacillus salivarius]EFK80251.1 ABC transporter, permease protein [Ligilactobacillus salivarius ACS-116-V-Col5a]OQR13305.1 spermidine/putrescine ABC transporter permease [Ligilactobacillus salivarius]OQR23147.1 spermidine/putrescine ABC transporter permease [Ligilactobacillus salivarius]OQR24443.1 spermidine/putrescine ABC transporter permease [Ligilactobacillus salivarius]OQR26155.1 spermidine/putrescine ABC transporter permease [Ligilactobacillus salivari